MPKPKHTELNNSPDGPWIMINSNIGALTFSFHEVLCNQTYAETGSDKGIIAAWVRARDAEGKPAPVKEPSKPNDRTRYACHDERLPASRRTPPPRAKR
jgi:hypothetical protein